MKLERSRIIGIVPDGAVSPSRRAMVVEAILHGRHATRSRRIGRAVPHALDVLMALPLFVVLTILSPLFKPRGAIVHPRYHCVNGRWYKTFLPEGAPTPAPTR